MAFRFLHTADWQIGKPFGDLPGMTRRPSFGRSDADRGAIAELAREREVDAVLVAGDAFDTNEVADATCAARSRRCWPSPGPGSSCRAITTPPSPIRVWTRIARDGSAGATSSSPIGRRRSSVGEADRPAGAAAGGGARRSTRRSGSTRAATREGRLPHRPRPWQHRRPPPGASEAANEIPADRAEAAGLSYLALGDWHGRSRSRRALGIREPPSRIATGTTRPGFVNLVRSTGLGAPASGRARSRPGISPGSAARSSSSTGAATLPSPPSTALPVEHRRCVVSLVLSGALEPCRAPSPDARAGGLGGAPPPPRDRRSRAASTSRRPTTSTRSTPPDSSRVAVERLQGEGRRSRRSRPCARPAWRFA